jgi:TPR repeat protein
VPVTLPARGGFAFCVQPNHVPDGGLSTWVADDTGARAVAYAAESARTPVPCSHAWGSGPLATARRIRHCAIEYAASPVFTGYPPTLAALASALPECLGPATEWTMSNAHALLTRVLSSSDTTVVYVAAAAPPGGAVTAYELFTRCVGGRGSATLDDRGGVIAGTHDAVRDWVAGCVAPNAATSDEPDSADEPADDGSFATDEARTRWLEFVDTLQHRCDSGEAPVCDHLGGRMLDQRGLSWDPPRALALFARACESGFADACRHRAEAHENGRRATRAVATAFKTTPHSAPKSITVRVPDAAQPPILRDRDAAIDWYRRACTLGELDSCLRAPRLRLERDRDTPGGSDDGRRALAELATWCDRGEPTACTLAVQSASRFAPWRDPDAPSRWRRRACALGDASACESAAQ